ncbi:hypothetical protein CC77DRAFT_508357 [Alternaria alternata]|uniref:Uncharacterized protein n=1 Tax=Alternaria alternata TaxID=5599 RepID=A0A177DX70_ALTAL|nr:hypothetical protein CC77DRAFT_508357 [Alternaria alternata]OAG24257.1 hypothetical protein CC77DRAFT_508357 [Alternaria alternata]
METWSRERKPWARALVLGENAGRWRWLTVTSASPAHGQWPNSRMDWSCVGSSICEVFFFFPQAFLLTVSTSLQSRPILCRLHRRIRDSMICNQLYLASNFE